jgi:subtilisin family serine protease
VGVGAAALVAALVCVVVPARVEAAPASVPSIVVLRPGASASTVATAAGVRPTARYHHVLTGFTARLSAAQAARLRHDRSVLHVVPVAQAPVVPPGPASALPTATGTEDLLAPVTALLGSLQTQLQGLLSSLGLGPAPQVLPTAVQRVGAAASPTAKIDGRDERVGATVALIDTGVDAQADLNLTGGIDCVDEGGWDHDDYTPVRNGTPVLEGHGTLVAGVAGAIDNNRGVVGVAPGVRLLSAKAVTKTGAGTTASLLCALDWAMAPEQHTDVINISLGWAEGQLGSTGAPCGTGADPIHEAICAAVARGIVVTAAAGNEAADAAHTYPAAYPEVITVSSLVDVDGEPGGHGGAASCAQGEQDDHLRANSNHGAPVAIAAVGQCVLTTAPGGGLTTSGGTSLATPAVSGAAALLFGAGGPRPTPAQVRERLLAAAEPGPVPGDPDASPDEHEGVLDVRGF